MGSITASTKVDKTGKSVPIYRAFIRRTIGRKSVGKSKVFTTKTAAADWIRNNENDSNLAQLGKARGPIFSDLIEDFVKAPPMSGTKFWSDAHLDFWREQIGQMKTGDISRGDINAGVARLQNMTAKRGSLKGLRDTGEPLTPATINRYLASLSSVFNFAINHEIIDVHPLKAGKVKKLKESGGRKRILTLDEEQRLYTAAAESRWPMMWLFLRMALTTGARKSELLKLRWKDVNLDESVAIIPKTKNDEPRALPLVTDVKTALIEAQKVRSLKSDFVFFDPRHPERPKAIKESWDSVRKRAGLFRDREDRLDQVCLHTTRHTVATKLLRKGANIAQTANITGHKTLSMLKRYTHLAAQDAVDLAEKLLGKDAA